MLDRRLLDLVPGALRHVLLAVGLKWVSLACDVVLVWALAPVLAGLVGASTQGFVPALAVGLLSCAVKAVATRLEADQCFEASSDVRRVLRQRIFEKLLRVGPGYTRDVPTAELVQLSVEGTEQLETYFGSYLPQLLYSVLAPLTLFLVLRGTSLAASLVLLACVPLIPVAIVLVQKVAKRILASYWDEYATLGDSFLENLQGLTTLKIYQADAARHEAMNEESERFRVVTMKVLRMQLNSIIVMDVVALGGAAAGMAVALWQLAEGGVDLAGCISVVLLSADFFLPMRMLGSYFHVAMNGMAAADKIFRVLDLPEGDGEGGERIVPGDHLSVSHLSFSYPGGQEVLHEVSLDVPAVGVTALVGESGSGKSTVAALLAGRESGWEGQLLLGGKPLESFSRADLAHYVTTVPSAAHLFRGSVRENLLMARPDASDGELWDALGSVSLAGYLRTQQGLDTVVEQEGQNLSGGQRQRLALARALLHESSVLVLDEATSNVDVESEDAIMAAVREVARYKAVVLISHRLANVVDAPRVYVLEEGRVVGSGSHEELLRGCEAYGRLWGSQRELEGYAGAGAPAEVEGTGADEDE